MLSILLPNVPTRWAPMEDAVMSANDGEQMAWRFLPERFRQSESGGSYRRDGARAAGERRFQKGLTQENDMSSKLCLGNTANRALKEAVHAAWALNGGLWFAVPLRWIPGLPCERHPMQSHGKAAA